ncbi:replication initiation protein [Escherichia coli]|uniref:replication initiation protein n=1 Tax=Escherichia coli TaxID=562 RepID=UPI003D80A7B7
MNGHAHLLYALNIAVRTAPDASVKALKYAAAVERSLCEKLCADVNYSGLICKNPFHLEWLVMFGAGAFRSLQSIAAPSRSTSKTSQNCA